MEIGSVLSTIAATRAAVLVCNREIYMGAQNGLIRSDTMVLTTCCWSQGRLCLHYLTLFLEEVECFTARVFALYTVNCVYGLHQAYGVYTISIMGNLS